MCTERKKRNEPTCVCRKKATQNTYYKWKMLVMLTDRTRQASKEDEEEEEESDVDE